jgi:gluconolactonase
LPDTTIAVEVVRPEFTRLVDPDATLTEVASRMGFTEGCCYVALGDYLVWSDIPNNRIMRWSEREGVSVLREPSGNTNGNTVDIEGRLLSCEMGGRRVSRTNADGSVSTLVDKYHGKLLTSPNDVVVKSDGTVWFSDPDYGSLHPEIGHGQTPDQEKNRVYRYDPSTGELTAVVDELDKPNGLAFSLDESVLYVGDTGRTHGENRPHSVHAFDVIDGSRLANERVFCEVDAWVPDGMRFDCEGNLWVAAGDGAQCFDSNGMLLGKIRTPEIAANLSFGRPDLKTLFITATSSVWSIPVNIPGASRPSRGA